jgi:predicted methyltransferase
MRSALFCLSLVLATPVAAMAKAPDYAAAIADPKRPAEAKALDEGRKPAETLAFLGLKPGMKAADIVTGSGYWAEIMADVVGPKGKVTGFEPSQFTAKPESQQKWLALQARRPEVQWTSYPFEGFTAPAGSFDFTLINLNYHDLYWQSEKFGIPFTDPAAFVKALYAATRPGGIVGVIDHVGPAGDTRAIADRLHRIDPAVVKADFTKAGFVLDGESPLLANPQDDHGRSVFDPAIRGKTDRFLFRFRKPK